MVTLSRFLLPVFFVIETYAVTLTQSPDALIEGEHWAVAYSGFREGQHPDRGEGAVNPSSEEILEDLKILEKEGFRLIRMYDSGENTRMTLDVIRDHGLPIKVCLGVWLDAEVSNHENCHWLTEPIPAEKLADNKVKNSAEVDEAIRLANEYKEIIVAINVGNEALVFWNDHMMTLDGVIDYVRRVKAGAGQPVTVAESYGWWKDAEGARLAAEVDFLGVHTYGLWEGRGIEEGMSFTIETLEQVREALPDTPMAILEAGWATTASEFGERAGEAQQKRYYNELKDWAKANNTTVFFFEAFDEPWKGDPDNANGAEKHWGLFFVDRTPKSVLQDD
ncbi:MAG: glycosyl hydrolase [Coraliomargaritaceae bacterium]